MTTDRVYGRPSEGVVWWRRLLRYEELGLLLLLVLVVGFFAVQVPTARQGGTYIDLLREVAPNMVAAVGITLLLLSGELDLSIGSMLAFTGVVTVSVFNATGSMWLGIIAGLLTGPLIGALNGYLVTVWGMNSLMTTLGVMFALRGLIYVWTDRTPVVDENGFDAFLWLYGGDILGVPVPVALSFGLALCFGLLLTQTPFGRGIYAIGGNETAARVSGIKVRRTKFILFVISGTTAALAGLILASQTATGYFDAGVSGFELAVIAAVVLGGVSLNGGQGSVPGAIIGVLILGMTGKGLRLMSIAINWQLVITGMVLMIAVYLYTLRRRLLAPRA